jgi:hypothetical protein
MGELKTMREERAAHFHQHERINEELEDHKGRIERLVSRNYPTPTWR